MFDRTKGKPQSSEQARFEALVEKSIQGDKEAFGDLCGKISSSVMYQVSCLLNADENAEDITQEVLLTVYNGIKNLREPKAFKKWLSTIVMREKNKYLTAKLRRGVMVDIDDYLEQLLENRSEYMPTVSFENKEMCKIVKDLVTGLPERQKEAVVLHYYNEFSITDTAEIMGVTVQCASQHLTLAAKKIKRKLEEHPTISGQSISAIVAMPIGVVLSEALQRGEAFYTLANQAVSQSILAKCHEYILSDAAAEAACAATTTAETAVTTVATATKSSAIAYICVAALTLATAAAVYFGGTLAEGQPQPPPANIVFYGGADHGSGFAHVNPESVYVYTDEMDIQHWWITPAGCDETVIQGEGGTANAALAQLRESGKHGEFMIHFQLTSQSWEHTVRQNFYIYPDISAG